MKKNKRQFSSVKDSLDEKSYFDPEVAGSQIFSHDVKPILNWGLMAFMIFALVVGTKLFLLQVQEGFINLKLAEGNRIRNVPVLAPRGIIVDANGKPLVANGVVYQLVTQINRANDLEKVDERVFEMIGVERKQIQEMIKKRSDGLGYTVIKDNVPREEALLLKSQLTDFGGFEIISAYSRRYEDESLSHALGYVGKISREELIAQPSLLLSGVVGKSGLEDTYDKYLQGKFGAKRSEVDATGRLIRVLSSEDPEIGSTVSTSIDRNLQDYAASLLSQKAQELNTKGALIAMDPRDGSIKALVSYPYFDPNKLSRGLSQEEFKSLNGDQNYPLVNRAISGEYPPGSSIKPFIATTGLEDGVISESTAFDTPLAIEIGQWRFPDWKDHGYTDVKRAIAESNNIFFFAVGGGWGPIKTGLGPERLKNGLEKFGFGGKTQIDLTSETEGFVPTPEWKKKQKGESWFIGNTYNMSIGQGDLLITPLQITNATCAIANGGKLYRPHLVSKILDQKGQVAVDNNDQTALIKKDIFSSQNLNIVKEGMRMTITQGSATSVFGNSFPLSVAGKTGTAQFGNEGKTHAWFTSFAPYEDPELVLTVLIEGGGEGFSTAAPIARDIYKWWAENKVKS